MFGLFYTEGGYKKSYWFLSYYVTKIAFNN
jgi:hypothetical protein